MDHKTGIVPEMFYDLIARLIPGMMVLIFCVVTYQEKLDQVIKVFQGTEKQPPMTLVIPVGLALAWVIGLLLSLVSFPLQVMDSMGRYPIRRLLGDRYMGDSKARRALDFIGDIPAKAFSGRGESYPFAPDLSARIKLCIQQVFNVDYRRLPWWHLLDYMRANADSATYGTVVKSFAEATCLRSLCVGSFILAVFEFLQGNGWHLSVLLGAISVVCLCGFYAYRSSVCQRTVLTLLRCNPEALRQKKRLSSM